METSIIRQGGQARCYRCGSTEIHVICHHCGRPMCSKHGPVKPTLSWFTENREFTGLSLGTWPFRTNQGAHCEYHIHLSPNYQRLMVLPGLTILLIGAWLAVQTGLNLFGCLANRPPATIAGTAEQAEVLRDPAVYRELPAERCYQPAVIDTALDFSRSAMVLVFGGIVFTLGQRYNKENIASEIAGRRTEVPFGLSSEAIEVTEFLNAALTLEASGKTRTRLTAPIRGEIKPGFRFTSQDRQRLSEYRRKYDFHEATDLPIQCGFLVLYGRPRLQIEEAASEPIRHLMKLDERFMPDRQNFFWLESEVNRHPYLRGGKGRKNSTWSRKWRYSVPDADPEYLAGDGFKPARGQSWHGIPIRVVPLLWEMGNTRIVRLQLQFKRSDFPYLPATPPAGLLAGQYLEQDHILLVEQAQIWIDPETLGKPLSNGLVTEVSREVDGVTQNGFQVEYRSIWSPIDEHITRFSLPDIRLDHIKPGARLFGSIRLRVPGLRSGIRSAGYFSALGYQVNKKGSLLQPLPFRGATQINLIFDLALDWLPFSNVKTVSGTTLEWPGTPSPRRVRSLLDALNQRGGQSVADHLYVRRVVESTPQISEQGEEVGSWHWDVSGRRYHQTFPVDFHIVIYGKGDKNRGATYVETTVEGQVFDQDSDQFLEHTSHELHEIIKTSLGNG